jgi:hypothetical protein
VHMRKVAVARLRWGAGAQPSPQPDDQWHLPVAMIAWLSVKSDAWFGRE